MRSFSSRSEELVLQIKSSAASLTTRLLIASTFSSPLAVSEVFDPSEKAVQGKVLHGTTPADNSAATATATATATAKSTSALVPGSSSWYLLFGGAGVVAAVAAGSGGGSSNNGGSSGGGNSNNGDSSGGGNSTTYSHPPNSVPLDPQNPEHFNTLEYRQRSDLDLINAKEAYANISSLPVGAYQAGQGITIAVLDTGVDTDHVGLDESIDLPNCGTPTCDSNYGEEDSGTHGSHVAGIAAADKDNHGMHGVAYNADILSGCANILGGCGNGTSTAALLNWSAGQGARVANMSYAYVHLSQNRVIVATEKTKSEQQNYIFGNRSAVAQSALKAGLIGVVAAGNHGLYGQNVAATFQPGVLAVAPLAYQGTSLENDVKLQWIAVVNLTSSKKLSLSSHACGVAAEFCLAAPGNLIYSTLPNNQYGYKSGTSMAAPQVSGAVAVVAAAFPTLELPSGHELSYLCDSSDSRANSAQCHSKAVVNRLFATAEDLGAAGVDSIYGQGLLDLEAATELIGTAELQSASGQTVKLLDSGLSVSSALGDSLERQLSDIQIVATDSYDKAGFAYKGSVLLDTGSDEKKTNTSNYFNAASRQKMSSIRVSKELTFSFTPKTGEESKAFTGASIFTFTVSDKQSVSISRSMNAASQFGLMADEALDIQSITSTQAFANPFQSFNKEARGASYSLIFGSWQLKTGAFQFEAGSGQQQKSADSVVAELSGKLSTKLGVTMTVGQLNESQSVLNTLGSGVWNMDQGSDTRFYGLNLNYRLSGKTHLLASYYQGATGGQQRTKGLFADMSSIGSNSFSAGMKTRLDEATSIAAFVTQPMAVQEGSVALNLPVGYQADQLKYKNIKLNLAPESRQTDFELVFRREFRKHNAFGKINLLKVNNAGNIKGENDLAAMVNFGLRF